MNFDLFVLCLKCKDPTKGNTNVEMQPLDDKGEHVEALECPKCKHQVALRADPRSGFGIIDELVENEIQARQRR